SRQAADFVAGLGISTVVIDGEQGPLRLGLARQLATRMGAEHVPVDEVTADGLTRTVRSQLPLSHPAPSTHSSSSRSPSTSR
ncbi:MAG: hypothetical protein WAV52_00925, partial [Luteococcus japonicus]